MVGTRKKSTETRLLRWLARKVRQVCDGGLRRRTMYLLTLVSPMSMPSGDSGEAERWFRKEAERYSGMIPNTIGA
jgi:hypothetical protein